VRGSDALNLGVLLSESHSRGSPDEHRMEDKTFNRRLLESFTFRGTLPIVNLSSVDIVVLQATDNIKVTS